MPEIKDKNMGGFVVISKNGWIPAVMKLLN